MFIRILWDFKCRTGVLPCAHVSGLKYTLNKLCAIDKSVVFFCLDRVCYEDCAERYSDREMTTCTFTDR